MKLWEQFIREIRDLKEARIQIVLADISRRSEKYFMITVRNHKYYLSKEAKGNNPDVIIFINTDTLRQLKEGKITPQQAFMKGKLNIKGNMGIVMLMDSDKIFELIPVPLPPLKKGAKINIKKLVYDVVSTYAKVPVSKLKDSTKLSSLNLDDIDMIEMTFAFEEALSINLGDHDVIRQLDTIGKIISLLKSMFEG